jgi:hypothetical protein
MNAAACQNNRLACSSNPVGCLLDHIVGWARAIEWISSEVGAAISASSIKPGTQEIGRQEKRHGTGTPGRRDGKSCVDIVFYAIFYLDPADPFRAGLEERDMIEFLERIPVGLVSLDILNQCHNGNTCLQGFGKWRHQKGRGRSVLGTNNANLAGYARIPVGHRSTHIFLPIGNLADAARLCGENDGGRQALSKKEFDTVP